MNDKNLIENGYVRVNDNTYEKLDKESGMKARLVFNSSSDAENNRKIEDRIINIIAS